MRVFNAIQIVALFVSSPLVIEWLHRADFTGSVFAFWASVALFPVFFIFMVCCVFFGISRSSG